tara:strand:+ start:419 stop:1786 length:1368 start_codon:yes stop_codon:yes gene_type:complete
MFKFEKKIIFLNSLIAIFLCFGSFGSISTSLILILLNLKSYKYAIYSLLLASIAASFANYENSILSIPLIITPLIVISSIKWFKIRKKINLIILIPIASVYIHSLLFSSNYLFSIFRFSIILLVIFLIYELLTKFINIDEKGDLSGLTNFLEFTYVHLIQFIFCGSLIRLISLGIVGLQDPDGRLALCIKGSIALAVIISFLIFLKIIISTIRDTKFISISEWLLLGICFLTDARGPMLVIFLTYIISFGFYRMIKTNGLTFSLLAIISLLNPATISSFILKNYSENFLSIFKLYEMSRGQLVINQFYNFISNPLTGVGFGIQPTGIVPGSFSFPWTQKFSYIGPLPISGPTEKVILPLVLLEEFGIILFIFLSLILIIYLCKKKAFSKIKINQEISKKLNKISFISWLYYVLLSMTEMPHFSIFAVGIPLSFCLMLSLIIFNKNQDLKIKESIN